MEHDFIAIELRQALQEPGCPVCRLRARTELRYIHSLLREHVNDSATWDHIVASLGYCPRHAWQTAAVEVQKFGVPLGNVIVYRHLTQIAQERLAHYERRVMVSKQPIWKRWLYGLLPDSWHLPAPVEIQPEARCRVCQIGDEAEHTDLVWLLQDLSATEDVSRVLYNRSDGLCLAHLRASLALANKTQAAAAALLVAGAQRRLSALQRNLAGFDRKNTWDYRDEAQTESERDSWLRALAFFAGDRAEEWQDSPVE